MVTALVRRDEQALTIGKAEEDALFAAVAEGDLAKLTKPQKLAYYRRRCEDLNLNPLDQPFSWLFLSGKLVLYANRQCAEGLRKNNGVSITKLEKERVGDVYVITAYAKDKEGREDSSTGAVTIVYPEKYRDRSGAWHDHPKAGSPLTGDDLANALMKAETKAKRRVTLSICGLGMLDETEIETIPDARRMTLDEGAADYERQHADIIQKAETQHVEEVNQEPATRAEDESQLADPLIDDATRRKVYALASSRSISRNDLSQYLRETHNIESPLLITVSMLPGLTAWMESVQP